MSLSSLTPILSEIGSPILKSIIERASTDKGGLASKVIDSISTELSVPATAEAIAEKYKESPVEVGTVIQAIEQNHKSEWLAYLEGANAAKAEQTADGQTKENGYAYYWRPTMSWLIIAMFIWSYFIIPVVNTLFGLTIPIISPDDILTFTGIWLTIYGGGNTIKSLFAKK